ncbi:RNA recognition motif domain-containing protein [Candidatus Xiphinematobacter sp. Idaho Grape]
MSSLSFETTEGDLFELFNRIGNVWNVEVVCSRQTYRSKGFLHLSRCKR